MRIEMCVDEDEFEEMLEYMRRRFGTELASRQGVVTRQR